MQLLTPYYSTKFSNAHELTHTGPEPRIYSTKPLLAAFHEFKVREIKALYSTTVPETVVPTIAPTGAVNIQLCRDNNFHVHAWLWYHYVYSFIYFQSLLD